MLKMVILIKKKIGMSREDFIHHYETSHSVIGRRLLGHLWVKYVRNYPVSLMTYQPEDNDVGDSYDAVTELWFENQAAVDEMARIINIPENHKLLLEAAEKFLERLFTRLLMVEEVDTGTTL